MDALAALLHEQEREEAWRAYMAQMSWYCARAMYGKEFKHPTWLDMVSPKPQDNRSGMEIVEDLKSMLRDRKQKRKGGK